MNYSLERRVGSEWFEWGTYDITDTRDLSAMLLAAFDFGKNGADDVRVVKVD